MVAPKTIADGLRGSIGVRNFELLRRLVDDVVTVSEAQIVEAMRIVLADFKLLIEPSSAVAGGGASWPASPARPGERVGIVISGGNIDLDLCPFLRGERLQRCMSRCKKYFTCAGSECNVNLTFMETLLMTVVIAAGLASAGARHS